MSEDSKAKFLAIGLDPKVVDNTLKNKKVTQKLNDVIATAGVDTLPKAKGQLLYDVATKMPENGWPQVKVVVNFVLDERIKTLPQITAAMDYYKKLKAGESIDEAKFSEACGVGIEVTSEDIAKGVAELFN